MVSIKDGSLYLLITKEYTKGRSIYEVARLAIEGGVDMIQLREKAVPRPVFIKEAIAVGELCRKSGVTFIVNDDPAFAKESDADGVHLGQSDLERFSVKASRDLLGCGKIIGVSTSSVEETAAAGREDIDYIGYGPVFPTTIKDKCVGLKDAGRVLEISKKPVFFIGGISLDNIDGLLAAGAKNVAVIRAITEAADIRLAAKKLKSKLKGS